MAKNGNGIQKWSEDYDKTVVIKRTFWALFVLVCGLMVLEVISLFVGVSESKYLTPELLHFVVGAVVGIASQIVTSMFAEAQHKAAVNGNHNGRNSSGKGKEEVHKEQTSTQKAAQTFEEELNAEVDWDK